MLVGTDDIKLHQMYEKWEKERLVLNYQDDGSNGKNEECVSVCINLK